MEGGKEMMTRSVVDIAAVVLCCSAYGVALSSTAIDGFWTGPDFDHAPMSGLDCLLSGWLWQPIGWLANPLIFAGVVLLLVRCRISAFVTGMAAIGLAVFWTREFSREFSAKLLMSGYAWWMASMQILVAGSFLSMVVHYSETLKSLRLRPDEADRAHDVDGEVPDRAHEAHDETARGAAEDGGRA
jgi:hypothetical protein